MNTAELREALKDADYLAEQGNSISPSYRDKTVLALAKAAENWLKVLESDSTLSSLFIVCSHGRRSAHSADVWSPGDWCPGGRPATLEDLGGEKVWLCIEREKRGTAVSNLPGSPNHCFFTSKPEHLPDCGERILIPLPQMVTGESL